MKYLIMIGTVTYALRARDILKKNNIQAFVKRVQGGAMGGGCGYGVVVSGDIYDIKHIITSAGIRIKSIEEFGG